MNNVELEYQAFKEEWSEFFWADEGYAHKTNWLAPLGILLSGLIPMALFLFI